MTRQEFDVYESNLATHQLARDREPDRASLFTGIKADHPADWATGEPCDCQTGGTGWERRGIAMRVRWPKAGHRAPDRELEAGA